MLLKGRDDLGGIRLTPAFRNATPTEELAALQKTFLSVAAATGDKAIATQALDHFYRAARRLYNSENEFNKRARRSSGDKLTVMVHMPPPERFPVMRDFSAAKAALLDISPDVGRSIVRLVAQGARATFSAASQQSRSPNL